MSGADGELVADRYQLRTRLGRGGMGEVWSARDLRLHRDVAVKLFHGGSGTSPADLPDWLQRESIAAAQIVHPNVAVLYDQGVHRDQIYLVLELVPGATLSDIMDAGRLPLRDALSLAAQIAEALAAAHAARVVHRDIKPQNVLVTPEGTAKVVDFGIAGFLAGTRSWTVASFDDVKGSGTPEYAAPEQVMGHNADARSDLYSLGTLLYAMLAGQVPFRGDDFLAVMHKKANEDAPPLPPGAGAPREVVDLVAELLAREPGRRPGSARRVAERLRALLERSGRGEAEVEGEGVDSLDRRSRVAASQASDEVEAPKSQSPPRIPDKPSKPAVPPTTSPTPAKEPDSKPAVWGASKEQVTSPETSSWEPLAATGATVLSAAAIVELRGRSLLPPPARSLLANPLGERYVPAIAPQPAAAPTPARRSAMPVLLILLAVAAIAIGAIVLTSR